MLKIDAPTILFPIPIARRIRLRRGRLFLSVVLYLWARPKHYAYLLTPSLIRHCHPPSYPLRPFSNYARVDLALYKHITVSGADAVEFLQGQLTQDVNQLERTGKLSAAWCNPKGRVICTLTLVQKPDSIGLLIPATIAEAVLKRLTMYRMRSAVEFIVDEAASNSASAEVDPRALIHAGIPTIDASNSEKFTPHMLNLDKLDAVSFTKGCYTGQEIVARTEKSRQKQATHASLRSG